MNNNITWTEKYRPIKLDEYYSDIKDKEYLESIKNWISDHKNDVPGTQPILILYGSPGIGKTTLAKIIFDEYEYESVEINASDVRNKKSLNAILSNITKFKINFGGEKVRMGLLLDEIDGMSAGDKGGIQEIIDI